MTSTTQPRDKWTPASDTPVTVAQISDAVQIEPPSEVKSPLTLAIFQTRRLTSFATPCHGRGSTFFFGAGAYAR